MAFTPKIPLRLVSTEFDTKTGLVILRFIDDTPNDEPNPADWKPTKSYTVSLQPTGGLAETPQA